jgi:hypothetical protein
MTETEVGLCYHAVLCCAVTGGSMLRISEMSDARLQLPHGCQLHFRVRLVGSLGQ